MELENSGSEHWNIVQIHGLGKKTYIGMRGKKRAAYRNTADSKGSVFSFSLLSSIINFIRD